MTLLTDYIAGTDEDYKTEEEKRRHWKRNLSGCSRPCNCPRNKCNEVGLAKALAAHRAIYDGEYARMKDSDE